jgi:tetratricopeptide (TPR) repeat protein
VFVNRSADQQHSKTSKNGRRSISRELAQASAADWNQAALNARIAYQMGEKKTALIIIENSIRHINGWLPTELKVFAVLLYKARLAFYNGHIDAAEACYQWAYEMMQEYKMEKSLGSIAAELFDEWGECLVILGCDEEATERYQMAVAIDLDCHQCDPLKMSPWRLAKLADFFAVQGATVHASLCLELAEAKANTPVEKMFLRTFNVSRVSRVSQVSQVI